MTEKRKPNRITKAVIKSAYKKAMEVKDNPRTTLNRKLIRQVAAFIETSPRYNQGTFGERAKTPCGTECCIAGEALLQSGFTIPEMLVLAGADVPDSLSGFADDIGYDHGYAGVEEVAVALLGLETDSPTLFNGDAADSWPEPYRHLFRTSPNLAAARYLRAIAAGKAKP
jgi:hypothetical protein